MRTVTTTARATTSATRRIIPARPVCVSPRWVFVRGTSEGRREASSPGALVPSEPAARRDLGTYAACVSRSYAGGLARLVSHAARDGLRAGDVPEGVDVRGFGVAWPASRTSWSRTRTYMPSSTPSRTSSASSASSSTRQSSPTTGPDASPSGMRYGMPYSPRTSRMGSRVRAVPTKDALFSSRRRWL